MADDEQHFPWTTGPTGEGATLCTWCDRDIYLPAMPCSIAPVEGLERMTTAPGFGRRCQYELATRRPDMLGRSRVEATGTGEP